MDWQIKSLLDMAKANLTESWKTDSPNLRQWYRGRAEGFVMAVRLLKRGHTLGKGDCIRYRLEIRRAA